MKQIFQNFKALKIFFALCLVFGGVFQGLQAKPKIAVAINLLSRDNYQYSVDPSELIYTMNALEKLGVETRYFVHEAYANDVAKKYRISNVESIRSGNTIPSDNDALIIVGGQSLQPIPLTEAHMVFLMFASPMLHKTIHNFSNGKKPIGTSGDGAHALNGILEDYGKTQTIFNGTSIKCPTDESIVDDKNKIVSTPGFALPGAKSYQVQAGIEDMVKNVMALAQGKKPAATPKPAPAPKVTKSAAPPAAQPSRRTPVRRRRTQRGRRPGAARTTPAQTSRAKTPAARQTRRAHQRRRR